MAVTRKFLNWNRPALPAAAEYLVERYTMMDAADMSGVVVVVPGRRAGRRLLELLIETADRRLVRLTPPAIETVGRLPERLYQPRKKFASDLVNKFAWTAALREMDDETIRSIIPDPPRDKDISRWLSFGELLWKQHRELAAEGLDFQDVIDRGPEVAAFDETDRWKSLRTIQESCLRRLDELQLWDLQSARIFAIRHSECATNTDIILIGTSDLNLATREMLTQVADRVTALIHAPEKLAKRFDEFGAIVPDDWNRIPVDIRNEQIDVVEGPADQARAVVAELRRYDGKYRADEVTVGVTDERIVPEIDRHLTEQGLESRWVVGQQLNESRPFRLLAAVAEYLETGGFDAFAALVRHADLDSWLCRQPFTPAVIDDDESESPDDHSQSLLDEALSAPQYIHSSSAEWLRQLDDYFNRHLPSAPGNWIESDSRSDHLQHAYTCLTQLLEPLTAKARPLGDWIALLNDLLMNVYREAEFDLDDRQQALTLSSCRKIFESLLTLSDIPPSLMPVLEAAQTIRLLLNELRSDSVPPAPNEQAIELLGWLELPLDDSPALVVTTFNDGYVPSSLNSDAFLPNSLRRHLGLLDNRRRYARDAYSLCVLAATRQDLKLIVARRDMRGDPIRPSRLLFAADPNQIAERVLMCFRSPEEAVDAVVDRPIADQISAPGFLVPRPLPLHRPIDRIGVTSFRTYLACPYRFYLQHVLRLRDVDDSASELDAMMFGNLMHEVLNRFGTGPHRFSTDADEIQDNLCQLLAQCTDELLGSSRLAAVDVQIQQLRSRLNAFAEWQASWAQEGWRILTCETSFRDLNVRLQLDDGRSVLLDGRIDRIDRREGTSEYVIFDYKSSENAKAPAKAHQKNSEWTDLQLPLYQLLAEQLGLKGDIRLGYIVLPKDTKKVQHLMAEWTPDEIDAAHTKAREVAAGILDEVFWPPSDVDANLFTEYAAICQTGVFDGEVISV